MVYPHWIATIVFIDREVSVNAGVLGGIVLGGVGLGGIGGGGIGVGACDGGDGAGIEPGFADIEDVVVIAGGSVWRARVQAGSETVTPVRSAEPVLSSWSR